MKKHFTGILVFILFIVIIVFQSTFNLGVERGTPSDKWAKEVKIGEAVYGNKPIIKVEEDRILTSYQIPEGIGISITDLNGQVIGKKSIAINSDFIKNICFYRYQDNYHLLYVTSEGGNYFAEDIALDSELNEAKREKIDGVFAAAQVDNTVAAAGRNSMTVIDGDGNTKHTFDTTDDITMIAMSGTKDKIVVAYMSSNRTIKTGTLEGDKLEFSTVYQAADISTLTYTNLVMSCDNDKQYLLFDESSKGEKVDTRYVEAYFGSSESTTGKLSVDGDEQLACITSSPSEDGGKFLATSNRVFGTNENRRTLVEFSFKDGQAYDVSNVSRVRGTSVLGYYSDGYTAYLSSGDSCYNVNLTSNMDSFKEANNTDRSFELTDAVLDTLQGFIMSLSYILVIGFRWIVPMMVICGVITFLDYKFKEKSKKTAFIVSAATNTALKSKVIYDIVYMTYGSLMPSAIASSALGIIICIVIGVVVFYDGYRRYSRDTEVLFIGLYGVYMLIDALLTCMVFVPFFA